MSELDEDSYVVVDEQIVLHKYDGDLTEEEMATAEPIETVVMNATLIMKNGEIIEVIGKEDNASN